MTRRWLIWLRRLLRHRARERTVIVGRYVVLTSAEDDEDETGVER